MFGRRRPRELTQGHLLAVDVETTGLTPGRDQLVAVGWVPVTNRVIDLSGARDFLVAGAQVGDSATLHGVTDQDIAARGVDLAVILEELQRALDGRYLLAHFAQMETGFISHALRRALGVRRRFHPAEVVDTFALERRHMERMGTYPRGEDLRLARVRERYGLPAYRNHDAVTDAIACAELYLALTAS
ncbi:exonuclease domain-containing protein [Corynebacterium timonense]|uniref:DNA polymerase-3 subunit epsilon n=1 Tax=Corynebacterium timonense TaxID=441500 RepID=A0A1H1PXF0_9CORY|nr:exonuclease domain-containing protein [Corynebacterium timonense]SDS15840.1 DNA polymerase-3 subunit epsilon [Corynebacterium timonense]